jgi:hypothetical protein
MVKQKIATEKVKTFHDLTSSLTKLAHDFYFRGMASDRWRLKTSIDRLLDKIQSSNRNSLLSETNQNIFAEFVAQTRFIKNQSQNLNHLFGRPLDIDFLLDEDTFLHLPVILQHYGYPTRVQDWTESWEIALYFCLEDVTELGDFCVWVLRKSTIPDVESCLVDNSYLYAADMFENNRINAFYHRLVPGIYRINKGFFQRIVAQRGITLVTGRADYMDFQQYILECEWIHEDDVKQIVIDKSLRAEVKAYLEVLGIKKNKLYPQDITDGYVESDKEAIEKFINEMYPNGIA